MMLHPTPTTAADLATGDCLLQLGDVVYPQALDAEARPVVVAATRPPEEPVGDLIEIMTSTGHCYTDATTPAMVHRTNEVNENTVLLISRRAGLHSLVCSWGFPVARRTPVTFDQTAHPVTQQEWSAAAVILIDGYLLHESIAALWERGDLMDRTQIVLLCTDPDDARTDQLTAVAHARKQVVLPYDLATMVDVLRVATGDPAAAGEYPELFAPIA